MKTETIYQYQLEPGYIINKIIPLSEYTCVVVISKYPDMAKIEIIGDNNKTIDISDLEGLQKGVSYKSFFKYKTGFGLIDYTDTLILWNTPNALPEKIKISNPHPQDNYGLKYHTNHTMYNEDDGHLYFGIEERNRYGFPAKYWSKLELSHETSSASSNPQINAKWGYLNQLELSNYPVTEFGKYPNEWLSICSLMANNSGVFMHTAGGSVTRLKSGPEYEFSLITELNLKNEFIKNYPVEEGKGYFSASRNYWICHPRKNKKKLLFYNTNNYSVDFEVSLTAKQNLANGSSNYVFADMLGDNLYLGNGNFFNMCRLLR